MIATIVSVGSIFGGRGGFILPLLAAVALLFLLHRSRAGPGATGGQPPSWPAAVLAQPQPQGAGVAGKGVSKEGPATSRAAVVGPAGRGPVRVGPARARSRHPARRRPGAAAAGDARDAGPRAARRSGHGRGAADHRLAAGADLPGAAGRGGRGARPRAWSSARSCGPGAGSSRSRCWCRLLIWGALSAPIDRFGRRGLRRPAGRADDRGPAPAGVPARRGRRHARPARARPLAAPATSGRRSTSGAGDAKVLLPGERRRDVHRRGRAGRRAVRRPRKCRARVRGCP